MHCCGFISGGSGGRIYVTAVLSCLEIVSLSVEEMEDGSRINRQCDQVYRECNSWKSVDLFLAGWHKDPLSLLVKDWILNLEANSHLN